MSDAQKPIIRIGGKTYSGLEDMTPEAREKFEKMVEQLRASGALEDKNRDGIPDRFETALRVTGWIGKLTGNPQLKTKFEQQLKAFNITGIAPRPSANAPPRVQASAAGEQPKPSPAAVAAPRVRTASRHAPASQTPAILRSEDAPGEGGLREFVRKLVIVSVVVGLGYVALRLLGVA